LRLIYVPFSFVLYIYVCTILPSVLYFVPKKTQLTELLVQYTFYVFRAQARNLSAYL